MSPAPSPLLPLRALVVCDDLSRREQLKELFEARVSYVECHDDAKEAMAVFRLMRPELLVLPAYGEAINPLGFLAAALDEHPECFAVLGSNECLCSVVVAAMEIGARGFLTWPFDGEKVSRVLSRAVRHVERSNRLRTQQHQLQQQQKAMDEALIITSTDLRGNITEANNTFCKISGFDREELIGKPHNIVRHPHMPHSAFQEMWETIQEGKTWRGTVQNRRKNGESYFVNATVMPTYDIEGNIDGYMSLRHDVTEYVQNKQRYYTNPLTGLPNRYKLLDDLEQTVNPQLALVNIDGFSEINNFFGHDVGDWLLREVARELKTHLGEPDHTVYKFSNDDYAVFSGTLSRRDFTADVHGAMEAIMEKAFEFKGEPIHLRLTAGFAFEPKDTYKHASVALRMAKQAKKSYLVYDQGMYDTEAMEKNLQWTRKLKEAIQAQRIEPFFQPILNNHTGRIEKYEALVRLIDEEGLVVSPYHFLEISKKIRLYPTLTKTVIDRAFKRFEQVHAELSINLALSDILDGEIGALIIRKLMETGMGSRVVFEILESEGIENYGVVSEFVKEVKTLGCKIAIDDFGTGYSNFEHILRLNVDYLKIDGTLIRNVDVDQNSRVIVETIVAFCQKLGIHTIAEFVHSHSVQETVRSLGVDYSQGYFIAEPGRELRA